MALPSISDLKLWVGNLLTKNEWNYNFTKIVSWFSDGTADLVVHSITAENGIDLNGSRLTNVGAATSGTDAVNLDTAQSLLNQTSYYTSFSVASGKEDSSGNSAFLRKDSNTQVTILAGNTNPDLVICQSDGTVETLTSNVVLTVGASDDTYYIIKEKGQTPIITSGSFGIGKVLPSSSLNAGDYFLDNSTVPFKGYKYNSLSGWVETAFCYLGKVEKTSGTATVTAVRYDDNSYNLNVYNAKIFPDYANGEAKTKNTEYTAPTNGYFYVCCSAWNGDSIKTVIINGVSFNILRVTTQHGDTSVNVAQATMFPLKKGDIYKYASSAGDIQLLFIPMKGGN